MLQHVLFNLPKFQKNNIMMKRGLKLFVIFLMLCVFAVSCKKYENGGPIRKAEKNLTNTWKIDKYYFDGTDATSALLITNFTETFSEGGSYSRDYNDASGDPKNETGTWSLDNDKMNIGVSGTGSYELTAQTSTVSTSSYDILKLTKDELWYSFENGGNTHEFHLVPN